MTNTFAAVFSDRPPKMLLDQPPEPGRRQCRWALPWVMSDGALVHQ